MKPNQSRLLLSGAVGALLFLLLFHALLYASEGAQYLFDLPFELSGSARVYHWQSDSPPPSLSYTPEELESLTLITQDAVPGVLGILDTRLIYLKEWNLPFDPETDKYLSGDRFFTLQDYASGNPVYGMSETAQPSSTPPPLKGSALFTVTPNSCLYRSDIPFYAPATALPNWGKTLWMDTHSASVQRHWHQKLLQAGYQAHSIIPSSFLQNAVIGVKQNYHIFLLVSSSLFLLLFYFVGSSFVFQRNHKFLQLLYQQGANKTQLLRSQILPFALGYAFTFILVTLLLVLYLLYGEAQVYTLTQYFWPILPLYFLSVLLIQIVLLRVHVQVSTQKGGKIR